MEVHNLQGVVLGKVDSLIPTGMHDILVVHGIKKHLIPYVDKRYIINISKLQQRITVDWEENFSCCI